jgi:transposase-like protein
MLHQIRAAMGVGDTFKIFNSLVEVDETYVGGKPRIGGSSKKGRGTAKTPVIGIIERDTKQVIARVTLSHSETGESSVKAHLLPFVMKTVVKGTTVMTDDFKGYNPLEEEGYPHFFVNHSEKQYSAGNGVHTNNIENFWSILKRGIIGVYHQTSDKYLQRYVNEACYWRSNMTNANAFDRVLKQSVMPEANNAWRVVS